MAPTYPGPNALPPQATRIRRHSSSARSSSAGRHLRLLALGASSLALGFGQARADDQPHKVMQLAAAPTQVAASPIAKQHSLFDKSQAHEPLLFAADDVTYDNQLNLVIARGNVQITQNSRTLLADQITYNQITNTVTASGHVSLTDPDGTVVFGDFVTLRNDMRDGFIRNIRVLLSDRSRMAGNGALRTDGTRTELTRGVYSPCDLCAKDPTRPPIWQIKAARIIHDENDHEIIYHDATLELAGVPVIYTPYLSQPDPTVKRKSGFLMPSVGSSEELGAHAEIPYFWAISPDKDFLFQPEFSTEEGVLLAGKYRQRFDRGSMSIFGAGIDALNGTDSLGNHTNRTQWRGSIDASANVDLTDNLRANIQLNRASDQTFTRAYNLGNWNSFLTSHAGLEDFQGRDYGSIDAYAFQSLRFGLQDKDQAIVAPIANYTWYGRPMSWGGKFTTNLNLMNLYRETGSRVQRASLGTKLERPFTTSDGELFNTFVSVRGDAYYSNFNHTTGIGSSSGGSGRLYPQAGVEWRYPFSRRFQHSTAVIEPKIALYGSSSGNNPSRIPNNDSQSFEFTDADLFTADRLYGYDLVDSGQRADYALHGSWYADNGYRADALFGQSYRFQKNSIFGPGTGLQHQASDYVGRLTFSPTDYLNLGYHFRLSEHSMQLEHQDVSAAVGPYWLKLNLGYVQLSNDPRDQQSALKQVTAGVTYWLDNYWSFNVGTVRNLGNSTSVVSTPANLNTTLFGQTAGNSLNNSLSVSYTDECITFRTSFIQSGIRDRDVKPGDAVVFQLVFKNLGEISLPTIKSGGG